jgi:hypothetical protein
MRIEEFCKSLQAFNMDNVFTIASEYVDETRNNTTNKILADHAHVVNLFAMHSKVDIETMKSASEFVALQGKDNYLVQNLLWSGTKLLNSFCHDKLRRKIKEKTMNWSVLHTTRPVYFKVIMMENILVSTPESMHGLMTILQDMKLSDFNGENVTEFISFARGAIEQLWNNNALLTDMLSLVAQALKACETQDFVSYINIMYNNHVQSIKRCTVDEMLLLAKTEYVSLVSAKKWQAKIVNNQSVFFVVTCYNCGEKGHMNCDCPNKKDKSQGSCGGGQGCGDGCSQGGQGGRHGRGGHGHIEKDKQPPKPGKSHTRTKNGRNEKWCGIHGYWMWGDKAHEAKDCPNHPTGNQTGNVARDGENPPTTTQGSGRNPMGAANSAMTGLVSHAVDF